MVEGGRPYQTQKEDGMDRTSGVHGKVPAQGCHHGKRNTEEKGGLPVPMVPEGTTVDAAKAEAAKTNKYLEACSRAGWLFMPFALETTGGWAPRQGD